MSHPLRIKLEAEKIGEKNFVLIKNKNFVFEETSVVLGQLTDISSSPLPAVKTQVEEGVDHKARGEDGDTLAEDDHVSVEVAGDEVGCVDAVEVAGELLVPEVSHRVENDHIERQDHRNVANLTKKIKTSKKIFTQSQKKIKVNPLVG